uniref:Scavenger receptor class F member 2 n=1 Tax=Magallana gigas TaxID=29159 RepID=A0A8W8NVK7_MAGGI
MLSVIVLVVVLAITQAYDNIALNKSTYQQSPYKPGDDTYDAKRTTKVSEVYGCHKTGYYTSNCSIPCPDVNCQLCHIETGACQVCKPGQQCELECDRGFFGIGCNEKCGHCRDEYQCSNETGVCLTGCGAGYKGDLCKTRCDKGSYGVGCNETCGHCRDLNQCSNVNGTCLTGCGTGYQGDLCKPHGKSRVTIFQRTVQKPFEQRDSTGHISKYLVDIGTLRTTIKTRNTYNMLSMYLC